MHKIFNFTIRHGGINNKIKMKLEFKANQDKINSYIENCKKVYGSPSYIMTMEQDGTGHKLSHYGIDEYGFNLNENRGDLTIYFFAQPEQHIAFIAVNEERTEILFQAEIL